MSKIKDGGPAFPTPWAAGTAAEGGMTMRDWFAGQAMQALIAKSPFIDSGGSLSAGLDRDRFRREIAASAYEYADAMLRARSESGQ